MTPTFTGWFATSTPHFTIDRCLGLGMSTVLCFLRLFADADFAGCSRTQRSTSGVSLFMSGPNTKASLSAVSKRQTAVSHSTPEAEMIAGAFALRAEGIPQMGLWDIVLQRDMRLEFAEDNEAMIKMCRSGHLQKMGHLSRTHKVNAAFTACLRANRSTRLQICTRSALPTRANGRSNCT